MVCRLHQGLGQHLAGWMQLEQRVANQAELIGHLTGPTGVTAGIQRPSLLGRIDALARLGEDCRVIAAECGHVVVDRLNGAQTKCLSDGCQLRRQLTGHLMRLGAEKQKIVQQCF
ncbi:hypothetical protein D9M69_591290 [compost metagenome]